MSRFLLALSIAAVGIALGGAANSARAPERGTRGAFELTSSGNVAPGFVTGSAARDDDEREIVRRALRRAEPGTYISDILRERDSALARWPDRPNSPHRVWIQSTSNVGDWHMRYVYEVHGAFVAWDTLDLPVRFQIVADSASADIRVTWIDHFVEAISGRTRWARDQNYWITDASIVLAVHHRTGEVLEDDAMHAMALHEIGHVLGLDHTTDPSSIMAPKVRVRCLSDADRRTARLLYKLPPGPLGDRSR